MKKLLAAMAEIQPITKDKQNPHFRSSYADINTMLAEVKPALHKHGLFIIQPIEDGKVITRIIDAESGTVLCESGLELSGQGNPQQRGSEITYYRRYTLQSLLSLEAEDDDGNAASATPSAPTPAAKEEPAKPWINKDNPRFIAALDWVRGKGDAAAKQATAKLAEEFAINKELRAAIVFEANNAGDLLKGGAQ